MESDRYTAQQLADMARRLDECIALSALCMDLALAGEQHRQAQAAAAANAATVVQGERPSDDLARTPG